MYKIICIVGARPQFIKHAPFVLAAKDILDVVTIHTGQHYDKEMSDIFFEELQIPLPKYMLHIGSHNHGKQTGLMMEKIEKIILEEQPDAVLVYGDTNSTLAGALAATKLHIPVIHVEAGLRSFNKKMPEEVNRILTDHISDILFVPNQEAHENLRKEGITSNIYITGDVMKDMLLIAKRIIAQTPFELKEAYYYATIHRPYNTDEEVRLKEILVTFDELPKKIILAIHPRTLKRMETFGLKPKMFSNISFIPPVSYFKNIQYQSNALAVITDSGGMQKEAYLLKKPCITIRSETEWRRTLEGSWNQLIFENLKELSSKLNKKPSSYNSSLYGDGNAAKKMIALISQYLSEN